MVPSDSNSQFDANYRFIWFESHFHQVLWVKRFESRFPQQNYPYNSASEWFGKSEILLILTGCFWCTEKRFKRRFFEGKKPL